MNKMECERFHILATRLGNIGFTLDEIDTLLRCERTLQRWAERECNGEIERNEDTGKPCGVSYTWHGEYVRWKIQDREAGALTRANKIAEAHCMKVFHQGDPRGCALYLYKASDLPEGKAIGSMYSTIGIAVCV